MINKYKIVSTSSLSTNHHHNPNEIYLLEDEITMMNIIWSKLNQELKQYIYIYIYLQSNRIKTKKKVQRVFFFFPLSLDKTNYRILIIMIEKFNEKKEELSD